MKLLETLERIERVDQLIRLKATGDPRNLAEKIKISERSIHRLIEMMKGMGAPIYYCIYRRSYCYEEDVVFQFGFYLKNDGKSKKAVGGRRYFQNLYMNCQNLAVDGSSFALYF